MAQQPTYLLTPSFNFKPVGPIALGNLIADPLRPHRVLTSPGPTGLESYPNVETCACYEHTTTQDATHDLSMGIWARFVQAISANVSGGCGATAHNQYKMEALEVRYFITDPTLEVIKARLAVPRVQAAMKANNIPGFRHPVYTVTGLMIAKGFEATQKRGNKISAEVGVDGSAPTPGGQAEAGVNVTRSKHMEEGDAWKAGDNIVFAYQLLKIEVKGLKGTRIESDELKHKAAFLSNTDDDGEDEDIAGYRDRIKMTPFVG